MNSTSNNKFKFWWRPILNPWNYQRRKKSCTCNSKKFLQRNSSLLTWSQSHTDHNIKNCIVTILWNTEGDGKTLKTVEFLIIFNFFYYFSLFIPVVPSTFLFVPESKYYFCSRASELWAAVIIEDTWYPKFFRRGVSRTVVKLVRPSDYLSDQLQVWSRSPGWHIVETPYSR